MLLRSRCKWIEEGEKPTKYFCALEKRSFINKNIVKLEIEKGLITKQEDILNEVKMFYLNLYSNKDNELVNVNLNEKLREFSVPLLREKDRENLEKQISIKEVVQVQMDFQQGFTSSFGQT